MSQLLEDKVEEKVLTNDTPPDKNRHYFKKEELDKNLLEGSYPVALCGFIKVGLAHTATELPICPKCQAIYDGIPEGD